MSNLLAQWVVVESPCEDVDGLPRERKIGKTITFFSARTFILKILF